MNIAFVCVANAARSQMAEGYARHFAALRGLDVNIYSAGAKPGERVHPLAVEVMKEDGIDISKQRPKGLEELPRELDIVVMVCSELCPDVKGARSISWNIPDPVDIEGFRQARDKIKSLVEELISSL
ncbi:MAG: arsenate reductase ArsC [Aquificaceae bacterium]|nr:arsenate reductase ArsC [Aquificaceae bacterium]MDW8237716.1 arsenate reductase ArsC [Aquificaceae bacterium]